MSTLRISDAPLLPDVDGTEKIPTGGRGDYAISVDQIKDHIFQDVGKELVGLGNVDNTSDLDKPVSTAQQAALDLKADKTYVDTNLNLKADKTNVYTRSETSLALSKKADLVNGTIPENQIPSSFNDVLEFTTTNLPIVGESGKIYVTTDNNKTWRWGGNKYVEISGWNPNSVSKSVTLPTYYTREAGVDPVTGVADGAYFNVRSSSDESYVDEYQNIGGVPTPTGKSYPSSTALNNIPHNNLQDRDTAGAHPAAAIMDASGVDQQQINDSLIRIVSNKTDLLTINNPRNKQVVYVVENEKRYIYNPNLTAADNGVTIIDKWEMEIQEAYYASWFATPNVIESQSLKLQAGYAYATSKGRSFIIDDLFYVSPITPADTNGNKTCIHVLSDSVLVLRDGVGKLKLISNNMSNYYLISTYLAKNFAVFYPDLEGDRKTHDYSSGGTHEWGYGLAVYECENGYIFKPRVYEMTGDGIYIGKSWSNTTHNVPKNITIIEPEVHHVRRNGLSFTAWDNVKVIRPKIGFVGDSDGIAGAFPKACIDIEPETEGSVYKSYGKAGVIDSPHLHDSYAGVYVYCPHYASKFNLNFTGVVRLLNIANTGLGFFKDVYAVDGEITFDEVYIDPMPYQTLAMWWDSTVGNIVINIKHLNCSERLGGIALNKHATNTSKKFGNVNINATVKGYSAIGISQNLSDCVVDSLIMTTTPQSINKFSLYVDAGASRPKFNGSTFIESDGSFIHDAWSANSTSMPNEVWQIPPDAVTQVFISSANDFRVLKIGLHHNVSTVGEGCNISGLNLKIDGVSKTRAHTKTLGGWLKFKNNSSGLTKIIDSYGVWTFS